MEYHGVDQNTNLSELDSSTIDYVSRSNFYRTIIHELVHIQQWTSVKKIVKSYSGDLLINRLLSEGIADFIAKLIVPHGNDGNYYKYGVQNENLLKSQLFPMLYNSSYGFWFGGNDSLFHDKPRDLGYFMGSRIAKSYYEKNKKGLENLSEFIEIKDFKEFVSSSHYFDNLSNY